METLTQVAPFVLRRLAWRRLNRLKRSLHGYCLESIASIWRCLLQDSTKESRGCKPP